MAKSNKSSGHSGSNKSHKSEGSRSESAAQASESKPSKSAKAKAPAAQAAPAIDPSRSAAAAAAMVGNGLTGTNAPAGASPANAGGSSMFKQLKDAMNKPHGATIGSALDKLGSGGAKKSATPFGAARQVGHNQTFGADVNRKALPRRTGG